MLGLRLLAQNRPALWLSLFFVFHDRKNLPLRPNGNNGASFALQKGDFMSEQQRCPHHQEWEASRMR